MDVGSIPFGVFAIELSVKLGHYMTPTRTMHYYREILKTFAIRMFLKIGVPKMDGL